LTLLAALALALAMVLAGLVVAPADPAPSPKSPMHFGPSVGHARYDVRYLRYWVDERGGKVFCLVEAPSGAAAASVHRQAHGLVPTRSTR
jgi:hypothetical protein